MAADDGQAIREGGDRILVILGRPQDVAGPCAATLSQLARTGVAVDAVIPIGTLHCAPRGINVVSELAMGDGLRKAAIRTAVARTLAGILSLGSYECVLTIDPVSVAYLTRIHRPKSTRHVHVDEWEGPYSSSGGVGTAIKKFVRGVTHLRADLVVSTDRCDRTAAWGPSHMPGWGVQGADIGDSRKEAVRSLFETRSVSRLVCAPCAFIESQPLDLALEIGRELERRGSSLSLVVVGSGPLEARFRMHARELGLDPYLSFAGARTRDIDLEAAAELGLALDPRSACRHRIARQMASGVACAWAEYPGCTDVTAEPEARIARDAFAIADAMERLAGTEAGADLARRQHIRMVPGRSPEAVAGHLVGLLLPDSRRNET